MCGNRRILFDNKTKYLSTKHDQLTTLLKLVDDVVNRNGGKPFSDEVFLEVNKDGNSDQEVYDLHTRIDYSHDEQLKVSQMVESKLKESTLKFERLIAEEQAARFRAEADVLRRQLQRSQQQIDVLCWKAQSGNCAIL